MKTIKTTIFLTIVILATLGLVQGASAATRTWDGSGAWNVDTNWSDNTLPAAGDVVVFDSTSTSNCSVISSDIPSLASLSLNTGYTGILAITSASTGEVSIGSGGLTVNAGTILLGGNTGSTYGTGVIFNVTGNVTVGASGVISANGTGFTYNNGPGAGTYDASYNHGTGASYGGRGGDSYYAGSPEYYGTASSPIYLGSGGGGTGGGTGGGAIKINSAGNLTVNGTISANGNVGAYNKGGGSGGSIWLIASAFAGSSSGVISADGGNGAGSYGGGGGGGRIYLQWSTGNRTFSGTIRARGGTLVYRAGHHGTIWVNVSGSSNSWDEFWNSIYPVKGSVALPYGTYNIAELTVDNSSTIECQSDADGTPTNGSGVVINSNNINIVSGSMISANGQGFKRGYGSGVGLVDGYGQSSGAGHGGNGGNSYYVNGGSSYGSLTQPMSIGSGGGLNALISSSGGGAIKLNISNTLTVGGTISANANQATHKGGGGSGGSVMLIADTLIGSGSVASNGGSVNIQSYGAGGGGGRIAFFTNNNQSSFSSVTVTGGTGYASGADGTIYEGATTEIASFAVSVDPTSNVSRAILGKASEFRIVTDASGYPSCGYYNTALGSWTSATSSDVLSTSAWSRIACTMDLFNFNIYVNGILKGTTASHDFPDDTTNNFLIGQLTGYTNFSGVVDDFKVYDYTLNEDEIKVDYNSGYAAQWGSLGGDATASGSTRAASGEYCVPGDTTACAPPVGEWKMDEKVSGDAKTIYDTSGNGNDGTTYYGANTTGMDCAKPGKFGSGCQLDGTDDYIDVGTGPGTVRTISFWVYPETTTEYFINLTSTTDYIWSNAGTLTATNMTSPTYYVNGVETTTIVAGQWQYVAITSSTSENASNLDIGRTQDSSSYNLQGKIDNVRLYDYARTPAQIAWEYNRGKPVAEWRFDECQGATLHDETTGGNDGTFSGASDMGTCTTSASTPWYNGRVGKYNASLDFDGSNDYIAIANESDFDFDYDDPFSGSIWLKADSTDTSRQVPFSKMSDTAPAYTGWQIVTNLGVDTDAGKIHFALSNTISSNSIRVYSTSDTKINDDNWHHYAFTYDGSSSASGVALYEDGVSIPLSTVSNNLSSSITNDVAVGIGAKGDGAPTNSEFFNGQIDEVKLFRYALTAQQVKELYNKGALAF